MDSITATHKRTQARSSGIEKCAHELLTVTPTHIRQGMIIAGTITLLHHVRMSDVTRRAGGRDERSVGLVGHDLYNSGL